NVLTAQISLPHSKYSTGVARSAFYKQVLERVRSIPGVQSAGSTSVLPFIEVDTDLFFTIEGQPLPNPNEVPTVSARVVSSDYFRTMGIGLINGRDFAEGDYEKICLIISESM